MVWLVRLIAVAAFAGASAGILALQRLALEQDRILAALGQLELDSMRASWAHSRLINSHTQPDDNDRADLERPRRSLEALADIAPQDLVEGIRPEAADFEKRLEEGQAIVAAGEWAAAAEHFSPAIDGALTNYIQAIEAAIVDASTSAQTVRSQAETGSVVLALLALGAVGVLVSQASRLRERATRAEVRSEETEGFFTLVRHATDMVTLVDAAGAIRYQNHASSAFLGVQPDHLLGTPVHALVHADDRVDLLRRIAEARRNTETVDIECRWVHHGGGFRMGHTTIRNLLDDARVGALVLTTRDTTERYRLEEELRSVVETSPLAIVEVDGSGRVCRWNGAAERLYGWSAAEVMGEAPPQVVEREEVEDLIRRVQDGQTITSHQVTRRTRRGEEVQVLLSAVARVDGAGQAVGLISFHVDATEQHRLEEKLRHQAFHDSLTGLANRELFTNRVELALAQASRRGLPVAALFLDLDDFKTVNDSLGHDAGDVLLRAVAERIQRRVRRSDTAARLGGDEFAVLLVDLQSAEDAEAVGRAILEEFRQPAVLGDKEWLIRGSIGIAVGTGEETAAELLRNADVAMYEAKHAGKGQIRRFEPAMFEEAMRRLDQKSVLRRAVTEGNIVVHFQPVVQLADARPVGIEALVRWDRPGMETVRPDELLPLAAELGLSSMIGREVLRQACVAGARLDVVTEPHRPRGWVAVNASPEHLLGEAFCDDVAEALSDAALSADRLVVEITELALLRDQSRAIEVLTRLQGMGVRIAFDDFGSGYSSLGHVQQAPIELIKLDRSFVASLDERRMEAALARLIIQLGSTLDLVTVAEGVETPREAAVLHRLGCELAQGYLYSPPVDLPSLLRWWGDAAFWAPLRADTRPAAGLPSRPVAGAGPGTDAIVLSAPAGADGTRSERTRAEWAGSERAGSEWNGHAELGGGGAEPVDDVGVVGDAANPAVLLGLPLR
jgi:diguanylate cyclase (GGDEF)-like protein/PAS domain S-box-containing protein